MSAGSANHAQTSGISSSIRRTGSHLSETRPGQILCPVLRAAVSMVVLVRMVCATFRRGDRRDSEVMEQDAMPRFEPGLKAHEVRMSINRACLRGATTMMLSHPGQRMSDSGCYRGARTNARREHQAFFIHSDQGEPPCHSTGPGTPGLVRSRTPSDGLPRAWLRTHQRRRRWDRPPIPGGEGGDRRISCAQLRGECVRLSSRPCDR